MTPPSRPSLKLPEIPVPGTKAKIPGWSLLVGAGALLAWLLLGRRGDGSADSSGYGYDDSAGMIDDTTGSDTSRSNIPPVPVPKPGKSKPDLASLQEQLAKRKRNLENINKHIQNYDDILAGRKKGKPGIDYQERLDKAHHNAEVQLTNIDKLEQQIAALGGGTGGPRINFGLSHYPERG
jgi:hypothetical protein